MAAKFRPCVEPGCNRNSHHTAGGKRERCTAHYRAWKEANSPRRCSVDGCNRAHYGNGLCEAHWQRVKSNGDLELRRRENGLGLDFIETVAAQHSADTCLPWPYVTNGQGYGTLTVDGSRIYAHRYVCELIHGEAPSISHFALHTCGNGHMGCVNPRHLRWGLPIDNVADARAQGTIARGETHGMARLSSQDVSHIRRMRDTHSLAVIAEQFQVSRSLISAIHRRKRWAHL